MSLFKSLNDKKFDVRMLDFNLRAGIITQAEYDAYKSGLQDLEASSVKLKVSEIASEGSEASSQDVAPTTSQESTQNSNSGFFGFNGGSSH